MSNLGSIKIKVPKGKTIIGVAVIGTDGRILSRAHSIMFRPGSNDWIQVEFELTNPVGGITPEEQK